MFQFDSLAAFFAMGGHGPYVWGAYLLSLSVLLWLVVSPLLRKKQFLQNLSRQLSRETATQGTLKESNEQVS